MTITGANFIGFNRSADGKERLQAIDPATSTRLPEGFAAATEVEIEGAMRLAQVAAPVYGRLDGAAKARFLNAIADEILGLGDAIVERAVRETARRLETPSKTQAEVLSAFGYRVDGSGVLQQTDR